MNTITDPKLRGMLQTMHQASEQEERDIFEYYRGQDFNPTKEMTLTDEEHQFFSDKMVALPPDKADFVYQTCIATGARNIVEVGTSFGVSTLYLADAVRRNTKGVPGKVIATEYEADKAAKARENFAAAGLTDYIELREGDLRETLKAIDCTIDLVLMDIWIEMVVPAVELIAPHLSEKAVLIADNTATFRVVYKPYFQKIEALGFSSITLPFDGGLEYSVRSP